MKIASKQDSFNQIKKMRLNRVPEIITDNSNPNEVIAFMDKHPASTYVLRDVRYAIGKTFFITNKEECLEKIKKYDGLFSLAVSIKSYSGRKLIGDIFVSGDNVQLTYSTDENANHRNLEKSLYSNLYDDALWDIPGFNDLIKYITDKNLLNVIVEFAVYDHPVGTNKEKVLIVELRTDY